MSTPITNESLESKTNDEDTPSLSPDPEDSCRQINQAMDSETSRGKAFLAPMPGHQWNPLKQLPRNLPCPCRSQKKFKHCCLPKLPAAVPKALADEYRKQMKLETLVFFTEENHKELEHLIPQAEYESRMRELEIQRAKAKTLPYIPMPNAWLCPKIGCGCSNHDDLIQCYECGELKPTGERLIQAREDAETVHKALYEKRLQEQIEKEKSS